MTSFLEANMLLRINSNISKNRSDALRNPRIVPESILAPRKDPTVPRGANQKLFKIHLISGTPSISFSSARVFFILISRPLTFCRAWRMLSRTHWALFILLWLFSWSLTAWALWRPWRLSFCNDKRVMTAVSNWKRRDLSWSDHISLLI